MPLQKPNHTADHESILGLVILRSKYILNTRMTGRRFKKSVLDQSKRIKKKCTATKFDLDLHFPLELQKWLGGWYPGCFEHRHWSATAIKCSGNRLNPGDLTGGSS
jgi:hypothetical protein